MVIEIIPEDDLFSIEQKLLAATKLRSGDSIFLRVARQLRPDFFLESRVAAMIATLGQRYDLSLRDWVQSWTDYDNQDYIRTTIVGITLALCSDRIKNIRKEPFPETTDDILARIAARGGILEPKDSGLRGSSISFCSFDPLWPEPPALAGTLNRQSVFKSTFAKYREKYLEVGKGLPHTPATRTADSLLTSFIYELYQNTYEHGRVDASGRPVEGMRYLRLRKHIDTKDKTLARTHNFPQLREYIERVIPNNAEFKFYEIAVSDHGAGIVQHYIHACKKLKLAEGDTEPSIKDLLRRPFTSKPTIPGAGYGLQRVLAAVSELQGFISIRTGTAWLCSQSGGQSSDSTHALQNVKEGEAWPLIAGTHFNVLLPVRVS